MAPEQLEGKPADARTDLWALGAILYEMLTGKRAFEGASAASLITAIMSAQPPALAALQNVTPASVDRLVRRCLAKDPDERWQSALDVADQLRWIREGSSVGGVASARSPRRRGLRVALLVAGALAMAAAGAGVMSWLRPAAPAPLAHVAVPVLPAESLNAPGVPTPGGSRTALAWTPDGSAIVFVGTRGTARQLYLRPLHSAEAQPIKGTENGLVPAVSPDGKWVAFYVGGVIKKMPLAGGPVVELMTVTRDPVGLAWDDRGGLFFGNYIDGRIWRIPAEGPPQAFTTLGEGELTHILPQALEGGARLLYTVRNRDWSWGDEQVIVQDLVTDQRSVLLKNTVDARYVPPGRLVFMRQGRLFGVRFDPDGTEVSGTGKEVPLLDDVAQALTAANGLDITGAGQFAISATGTLAWVPSPVVEYPKNVLVAVDRSGHVTPLLASAGCYGPVRVSPDGTQLAVSIVDLTAVHLSLYDLDRGTLAPLPG
jgi:serine/threonine-protein kinase